MISPLRLLDDFGPILSMTSFSFLRDHRVGFSLRSAWAIACAAALTFGATRADQTVTIDGTQKGPRFDGIGAVSANGPLILFKDYPETQRKQILDLLFKPDFGASMSSLYIEIGSDGNSTGGSELSHMHTRDDHNYGRGYEWWLMREAKQRNPDIKLDACPWGAPGWIGHGVYDSQDMCDYLADWAWGLKKTYGLTLDAIGCHNEKAVSLNFPVMLRQALDAKGLQDVRIHGLDLFKANKYDFTKDMETNPALKHAISIFSCHVLTDKKVGGTPAAVQKLSAEWGKPIWDTEEHVYRDGFPCELYIVKAINENFLYAAATSTVFWYLQDSFYGVQPFKIKPGMLVADSPWSGHYTVREALWGYAHYGQFSKVGWQYLPQACGYLSGGGSYVTLKSPQTDYSVILETSQAKTPQTITFQLGSGVSPGNLCVWRSNAQEQFVRQADLVPVNGTFQMTLDPNSAYSISTTTGQQKGSFADIPAESPFPFPYHESFDEYGTPAKWGYLPHYTADIGGGFELAKNPCGPGGCLQQITDQPAIAWAREWNALTILGDMHWKDYEVLCDVLMPNGEGWTGLMGRISKSCQGSFGGTPTGYLLRVNADGSGGLYSTKSVDYKKKNLLGKQLATFTVPGFNAKAWHRLRLRLVGDALTGFVDGVQVAQAADADSPDGLVGLVGGTAYKKRTMACFKDLIVQSPNATASVPLTTNSSLPMYPSPSK